MKTTLFILAFILISLQANSQELSRSGQTYIKFYNQSIEKLKKMDPKGMAYDNEISQAENNLNNLKISDPSYNSSSLTDILKEYKDKRNEAKNTSNATKQKNNEFDKKLEEIVFANYNGESILKSESDEPVMEKYVNDYQQNLTSFLTSDLAKSADKKQSLKKIEDSWKFTSKDPTILMSIKKYAGNAETPIIALKNYYEVLFIKIKWSNLSQAFPESTTLQTASKESNEALVALGDKNVLAKKANAKKAENLAKVKLKPSKNNDPNLLAECKAAASKIEWGKGQTFIEMRIINEEWQIYRNSLTGIIEYRAIGVQGVIKNSGGKCILHQFNLTQAYDGSKYLKSSAAGYHDSQEILCENANK